MHAHTYESVRWFSFPSRRFPARLTAGLAALALSAFAQDSAPIRGQWIIDGIGIPDQIELTLHRNFGGHGSSTNSSSFRVDSLKGLSQAQMASPAGSTVQFSIARDAGTLVCEGYFKQGNGAGTFTFSPDANFAAEMRKLGYEVLKPDMFFSMAAHDVSLAYVRELRSLNIRPASADDLISMRIHGVSVEFIKDLQSLGYGNLPADELVTMRIHGVTTDFIRELKSLGYDHPSADQLVTMRIHGVPSLFARARL